MTYDASSIAESVKKAKRVYIIGNGGSGANAEHISNDLQSCGVRAHTLNLATLTAWSNDFGYEHAFSKWISLHGEPGDMLIALSGSGKSPNILAAIDSAKRKGMETILVTDHLRTRDMQQSEEDQIVLGHDVMRLLRDGG